MIHRAAEPICWALVPGCRSLRVFSEPQIELMIAGYVGLAALTLFKLFVLALDFRLRRNQHYLALWVTGVFLLVPGRREALRVLLVLFYFWTGTLKLNWEWLSGGGLYRPLWFIRSHEMIMAACAYMIVMELFVAWGLLSARRWIFWGTFAQLALFHVMSWPVVGFFYPVLMFILLTLVPLDRLYPSDSSRPGGKELEEREADQDDVGAGPRRAAPEGSEQPCSTRGWRARSPPPSRSNPALCEPSA